MISTDQLTVWYVADRLSWREIELKSGLTRQAVWKRLTKAGVLTDATKRKGQPVERVCAECGKTCLAKRWTLRKQRRHFCGTDCYMAWLRNPNYHESRQGQRRARAVVREFFRSLQDWHIVHHEDANTDNNDPCNLMVFASQGDHLAWHHGNPSIRPLWRGDGK